MGAIRPFLPLLIAAGILLGGNGLFSTLIAVRGVQEGMSISQIGWMGGAYYLGFLFGCVFAPHLLRMVGYVRTFSALAALASASTLLMIMVIDPSNWMVQRLIIGFCFSGLFTTIESWLNSGVGNEVRGKVLAVYRTIDIAVVSGSQYMLPIFGTDGFILFAIMALMISISLIPVSLADRSSPKPPAAFRFDLKQIWLISPLACAGCLVIGITNAAFRFVGPLFGSEIGLDLTDIATFISLGVIGGAVLQYPLGYLSDRYDRRMVLIAATFGAVLGGLFLSYGYQYGTLFVYGGVFVFGAFSLPLFSLSAAHANDRARDDQYVLIAAGLMFFYGIGAVLGPPISSLLLNAFGPVSLFVFTSFMHGGLMCASVWRIRVRDAVPDHKRGRFTMLVRTSPFMQKLTRHKKRSELHENH